MIPDKRQQVLSLLRSRKEEYQQAGDIQHAVMIDELIDWLPSFLTDPSTRYSVLAPDPVKVTPDFLNFIIEHRVPYGQFFARIGNEWAGVDNGSGEAWTEAFVTEDGCRKWLEDSSLSAEEVREAERPTKGQILAWVDQACDTDDFFENAVGKALREIIEGLDK